MAASSSPVPFFGISDEDQNPMKQHHSSTPTSSSAPAPAPAPQTQKKKRNQPGTPNPDAEVIALSPKTLTATNRFICEVCNKGFQREQNLQLHRRGHNLPWKLKQKTTNNIEVVKRKVYVCPEPTCVHHDPSRALGDLTGIKKHYFRKHGEKKWKCDKCSKRYAVQSDWKAHSKTCGTREYRCDCGTLFSRRDSFITHRAFCDALAQESSRNPPHSLSTIGSHLYGSKMSLHFSQLGFQISSMQEHGNQLRLEGGTGTGQFDHLLPPSIGSASFQTQQHLPSSAFLMQESNHNYHDEHQSPRGILHNKPYNHGLMQFADLQNSSSNPTSNANLVNLSFLSNNSGTTSTIATDNNPNSSNSINLPASGLLISNHFNNQNVVGGGVGGSNIFPNSMMGDQINSGASSIFNPSVQNDNVLPHISATALLQKAAQLGSTSSNASLLRSFGSSSSRDTESERPLVPANFGGGIFGDNEGNLHNLMNSFATGNSSIFGSAGHDATENPHAAAVYNGNRTGLDGEKQPQNNVGIIGGSDRLTRDFLGVGQIVRSMSGGFSQQREKRQQQQQQQQQRGIDMASSSSLDSEIKMAAAPTSQSFGGHGSFQ